MKFIIRRLIYFEAILSTDRALARLTGGRRSYTIRRAWAEAHHYAAAFQS